jgi:predicted GIY-YIG superfamily endonuclease
MSWKIYLIKHLDTDMKYVGITGGDLVTRWEQHRADTNSAVYKALRTEGYRMTMELLEEVTTKPEALKKEQEYIQSLGTATPNGWNRKVSTLPPSKPKKWERCENDLYPILDMNNSPEPDADVLLCPNCGYYFTHTSNVEVYDRRTEDGYCWRHVVSGTKVKSSVDGRDNPSPRREGIRIYFSCESCHADDGSNYPPPFELLIYQHKGQTFFKTVHYIEDNS